MSFELRKDSSSGCGNEAEKLLSGTNGHVVTDLSSVL